MKFARIIFLQEYKANIEDKARSLLHLTSKLVSSMNVDFDQNQEKNRQFYEKLYSNYPVSNISHWVKNLDVFLEASTTTEASWFALYKYDFRNRIKGKKVLEMGCGDGVNASIMAALGADVYANDIAAASGRIIEQVNREFSFDFPIKFIEGDFLNNKLESNQFDFVIGKAFLHHLEIEKAPPGADAIVRVFKK